MPSETMADIVVEMRKRKEMLEIAIYSAPVCYSTDNQKAQVEIIDEFLDRIEAAAQREREIADAKIADLQSRVKLWTDRSAELVKKCNEHYANAHKSDRGNAAAMREALQTIHDRVNSLDEHCGVDPVEIRDIARAALAKPQRNCDVGTVEEQEKRYEKFCDSHKRVDGSAVCSPRCPLYKTPECSLAWAQMPYEEGGAK